MKSKSMLKVGWLASMCLLLIFGFDAAAQTSARGPETPNCSDRTLFGDYGVQIEGTLLPLNWPIRTLAMVHFNGDGTFTYVHYRVVNGTPVTPDWVPDSGTYAVNPDCTASAVFDGPIPVHLVVVNNGKEIRGVVDGSAITLVGSRVR